MEIKDFILKPVNDNTENQEAQEQPKKKRSTIEYEIAIENESDFVINRKTTRSETSLVVIVSQTPYQAYIKKGDEIEMLTPAGYARFMADYSENTLPLTKPTWIDGLNRGNKFGEGMLEYLNYFADAAKLGVGYFSASYNPHYRNREMECFCMAAPKLAIAVKDSIIEHYGAISIREMKNYAYQHFSDFTFLSMIEAVYGLDNARIYIKEVVSRGLVSADGYAFSNLYETICHENLPRLHVTQTRMPYIQNLDKWKSLISNSDSYFQFKTWLEYSLSYEREGYQDMRSMFNNWTDDLRMQQDILGKIKEKYPDNLKSHHDRLAIKRNIIRRHHDVQNLLKIGESNKHLECRINGNIFIVPKTAEEMVNEAIQQNNCLRSYIPRMAEGGCIIVFMRKAKEPEKSWITIELSPALEVVQIKGRNNKEASPDALLIINKWAKKNGLSIRDCYSVAC